MFWKFVLAMFLASWLGTFLATGVTVLLTNAKGREMLDTTSLETRLHTYFPATMPLLAQHGLPASLCEAVLDTVAVRMLELDGADPGNNSFRSAVREGRFVLSVQSPAGPDCRYPSEGADPALLASVQARVAHFRDPTHPLPADTVSDGWITTAAIAPAGAPETVVVAGFRGVSALTLWRRAHFPWIIFGSYILTMNLLSAIALVFLIVRRIKRAERAATAWTDGKLQIRINDRRQDEFARLSNRFDLMADAMSEVIKVKQSLAAAEERNRLARDLHDTAKQRAFAVGLQLSTAKNMTASGAETAPLLNAAISLTTQLQRDLSDTIRRLSAPTIVESGLRQVLTEGIDALVAGTRIGWTLDLTARDEQALHALPDASAQLFMVTTEAVANILKHAHCTAFWVTCHRQGDTFTWRIFDNGCGFRTDGTISNGMGLSNMKLRASSLPEGTFALVSHEHGGTSVTVTFRDIEGRTS